eukprot:4219523-Pyramimonas_sp.AAC.1
MKSRHSWDNKECRAPCPVPVAAAGNDLCRSGSTKEGVPKIEVGVPFSVWHRMVQYDTCSSYVASRFASPSSRSSFSQIHPWAAEPPEG